MSEIELLIIGFLLGAVTGNIHAIILGKKRMVILNALQEKVEAQR